MDFRHMTAPCGIPCFECPAYKATSNDAIRKRVSDVTGLPYEKAACEGCRSRNGKAFLSEKNDIFPTGRCLLIGNEQGQCKIFLCTEKKQIHHCGECDDFPCDNLQPLSDKANRIPHNLKVYNIALIKKMGLENWAKEKAGPVMRDYMAKKFDS